MKKITLYIAAFFLFAALFAGCTHLERGEKHALDGYAVVYAAEDSAARAAAEEIAAAISEETGIQPRLGADAEISSGKEILVGEVTNREYSYFVSRLSKTGGWDIRVLGNGIYITSDTGEYSAAVSAFAEYFIRSEFSENTSISSASAAYRIHTAEIGSLPLGCYDIVYLAGNDAAQTAAKQMQAWIAQNVGYELPLRAEAEKENVYNIYVAEESGAEEEDCLASFDGFSLTVICAPGQTERAAESFIAHFFRSENADVRIEESVAYKIWEYLDSDFTREDAIASAQIAEGVSWENYTMTDADGTPQSVFVLEAKAGAGWQVRVGTDANYQPGSPAVSTVLNTAQQYQNAGTDVLFACNGGYFEMQNGNVPEGILIRDGVQLSAGLGKSHHDFFGVTKSGEFVIGEHDLLQEIVGELQQACGGRGVILREGEAYDISFTEGGDGLGVNVHPRTSIGFRENGDLLIVVVDGRQAGYSVGINLVDLAQIYKSLSASYALNLDGGGSSTFVVKDADGVLRVKNSSSESGHALRAVGDCILVTKA